MEIGRKSIYQWQIFKNKNKTEKKEIKSRY